MLKNKHVSAYKDIIIMLIAIVLIVYLAQQDAQIVGLMEFVLSAQKVFYNKIIKLQIYYLKKNVTIINLIKN